MGEALALRIGREMGLRSQQVARTLALLDAENTLPFIARYRKEVTGGLDEVQIGHIASRAAALRALEARRAEIHRLIEEQGKLTAELTAAIAAASTLQALEDLYLPFRPKRRTRAMVARERGLEPLAQAILDQVYEDREALAARFVDPARGVTSGADAVAGARDIVAEILSEDAQVRGDVRALFHATAQCRARLRAPEDDPERLYEQYYAFDQLVAQLPPHRVLALNRAERAGILQVTVDVDAGEAEAVIARWYAVDDRSPLASDLRAATADSFARLLAPSLERELRAALTERAEQHAITVFAANLRPLLLQPPLRGCRVLGIDPGFRTGCKVAVVDETGRLLTGATIFPHPPQGRWVEAAATLKSLIRSYRVTVVAIGSGTAGRETEVLVAQLIAEIPQAGLGYVMVDEAGASVYSVSEAAREEFPDLDATERGVVSIARRLQDPLAELVKIDPQAIGVGLYQHDIDRNDLAQALDQVVISAVTSVGVDVNTASRQLLSRVAGLNRKAAAEIVRYRETNGAFRARGDLLRVPGLGPRTFQQAAGFLRIPTGADLLDRTFIHPENYAACRALIARFPAARASAPLPEQARLFAADLAAKPGTFAALARELGIGEPTLQDMLNDLARPGLDPREDLPPPLVRTALLTITDLREGMLIEGTVRNVVDFGAFVDIGIKQNGLLHITEMADRFISSPHEIVCVGQRVRVRVKAVDVPRGRIALSMRAAR